MAALAKELGITQSTLTNIQNATRSASPDLIRKIERLAPKIEGGSILGAQVLLEAGGDVEQSLNIGKRLEDAYRERLQELQSAEERMSVDIRAAVKNFGAMGKDDVFIFISATQQPFEMNPNETVLKAALLNAIRRGSFFIYLRPVKEHLKRLAHFLDVELEFESFKATLFSSLSAAERQSCADRLVLVQAKDVPLFVVPDFKWDIFYSDHIETPCKSLASAGVTAGADPESAAHIRVPLSVDSTKCVLFEVAKAISQRSSGRGRDKLPRRVIERLVESAMELKIRERGRR
jgi:transcriptional regulator with XRE-family HTH domain